MLIPQSTVEALHKAHANGHKLFLCTGRNLRMTRPLLDYGFDGAVCSAGGYVFCGDKVLVDLPMEPQLAKDVRSAMERHGVECTLEARAEMIKKALGVQKGSSNAGTTTVGTLSADKLKEIAEYKMPDLNAYDLDAAMKIVAGTAKNMGVKVEGIDA